MYVYRLQQGGEEARGEGGRGEEEGRERRRRGEGSEMNFVSMFCTADWKYRGAKKKWKRQP